MKLDAFRRILPLAGISLLLFGASGLASASSGATPYPAQKITIIVPNPPGSATDTLARIAAEGLQERLGQAVIVDNKPGAQGIIGVQSMKRSAPDGYTLIVSFSAINSSNPWLKKDLPYDYDKDFTHIVPMVRAASLLLVNVDSPYRSVSDLIAKARQSPDQVAYAYGQATSQVMAGAFVHAAGLPSLTGVPYKGQPQALTDLVGKQVDFIFADLSVSKPFVESGRLRALAISTAQRSPMMPDTPTLTEAGLNDYDLAAWVGISGPAGIPAPIADTINRAVRAHFATPAVQEKIQQLGFTPLDADVPAFGAFVRKEYDVWGNAIRASGIEPM